MEGRKINHNIVSILMIFVYQSNIDEVKARLTDDITLLTQKTSTTDYSGRQFENISPFQYAIWAWDTNKMCSTMLACIPQGIEGDKIKGELAAQIDELETNGIVYHLENKRYQEKHYNIMPLFLALIHYQNHPSNTNWLEVGVIQKTLPINLAKFYNGYFTAKEIQRGETLHGSDLSVDTVVKAVDRVLSIEYHVSDTRSNPMEPWYPGSTDFAFGKHGAVIRGHYSKPIFFDEPIRNSAIREEDDLTYDRLALEKILHARAVGLTKIATLLDRELTVVPFVYPSEEYKKLDEIKTIENPYLREFGFFPSASLLSKPISEKKEEQSWLKRMGCTIL